VVRRELQALILALVGGTLLKLAITGDHERYVKPGAQPYLIAAGVVVLVIAGLSLWLALTHQPTRPHPADPYRPATDPDDTRPRPDDARTGELDDHGHRHGSGRFDIAWLLVLPMLVLLLLAPPALGSFSAARAGTALNAASAANMAPLPAGDPVRLSVLDYATRAVFDKGRSLEGRQLTLSGFLLSSGGDTWYLTRMVINCCAADAQPVKVGLAGDLPAGLRANDWLQVTGTYLDRTDQDPVNRQDIPYLKVTSSAPIPAPARPYES
jgi:uncharacterized repeat protein (TIGR03943 family)